MTQPQSDVRTILAYHEATDHSVASVRSGAHALDFTNRPRPWKLYEADLPEEPLPVELTRTGASVDGALFDESSASASEPLTFSKLASVLQLSAGITKQLRVGGGYMYFRAAACTGALYHIDLYAIVGAIEGLPSGVYHYGVHDNALRRLRDGDQRAIALQAAGLDGSPPPAGVIVFTSTFWRNSWKYASRAYRHAFWDSGTILANALAASNANGLSASVHTRFIDATLNHLIGVDGTTEATVALLTLGAGQPTMATPFPAELTLPTLPLSRKPVDFPWIGEAHAATSMRSLETPSSVDQTVRTSAAAVPLPSPAPMAATIEEVILKRGSSRRFARRPIALADLASILRAAASPTVLDGHADHLNDTFVVANDVEGLAPGVYRLSPQERGLELELVEARTSRSLAEHLALDQPLGGDAAANLYFVADLPGVLDAAGSRGYRTAHLDASIRAGRVYLAAYGLGLGASGLTFYDREVLDALHEPSASAVTFLVAVGVPFRRQAGMAPA